MFQFTGLASRFASGWYIFNVTGCPIRKSSDISLVCSSPKLIAAYHVLHRLLESRHPPYALICFKKITKSTHPPSDQPFQEDLPSTWLLHKSSLHRDSLIHLIIVITRHYNFFSQYVKELNALPVFYNTVTRRWCVGLEPNDSPFLNHTLSLNF